MSGGDHYSFPWVFGQGNVDPNRGTNLGDQTLSGENGQQSVPQESSLGDLIGDATGGLPPDDDNAETESESRPRWGELPRGLLEAQGYLELATGPAARLGLASSLRRKTLRTSLRLAVRCAVDAEHRSARSLLIGQALRLLGRYRLAILALRKASFDKALRRDALLGMAWCQKRLGWVDESVVTITRALAASPDDADLHYNLACYLALVGQPQSALYELAWAIELKPRLRRRAIVEVDFDPLRCTSAFWAILRPDSLALGRATQPGKPFDF